MARTIGPRGDGASVEVRAVSDWLVRVHAGRKLDARRRRGRWLVRFARLNRLLDLNARGNDRGGRAHHGRRRPQVDRRSSRSASSLEGTSLMLLSADTSNSLGSNPTLPSGADVGFSVGR